MLIISLLGALMNHIRGGFLTSVAIKFYIKKYSFEMAKKKAEAFFKPLGKNLNDFVYTFIFCFLLPTPFSVKALLINPIIFVSMRIGRSFGWGGYIEAMVSEKIQHNRNDIKILDKWFRGDSVPVLSGWTALSCRGFIWSTCLYLGFLASSYIGLDLNYNYHFIPFVGLMMGTIYLLAIKINKSTGWQIGEILFGAYLWGSVSYLVGI